MAKTASQTITIQLVRSFTQDPESGSPTGIVLHADHLSEATMQRIAQELNFAETAFVQKARHADVRLRFFAPNHEVALCGHATIATFHLLMELGVIKLTNGAPKTLLQETKAGELEVTCHADGRIVMAQSPPVFGDIESDRDLIAQLLGLAPDDFSDLPLQVVSTGTPKLLIPVKSVARLRATKPDLERIKDYCWRTEAKGFYPFTSDSPIKNSDFYARQFNPLADENEDPITGVAAGALGCYAKKYKLISHPVCVVAQGYDMDMGGLMYVDATHSVHVGGYAATVGATTLTV